MSFVALLGAHPLIAAAELTALGHKPRHIEHNRAWLDTLGSDPQALMSALGGTHRLLQVLETLQETSEKTIIAAITRDLQARSTEGKLTFSVQGDPGTGIKDSLSINLKRHLQSLGRSARAFAVKGALSPAIAVIDNGLLKKGGEYFVLKHHTGFQLARTIAIQDIEEWGRRDFGRPRRNAKQGMLPPKLARMMVNLAGDIAGKSVLDPFCGSGTILMEAGARGAAKLYGSDLLPLAVADTGANLTWSKLEAELVTTDACQLRTGFPDLSVDLIITETYLGAPQQGQESPLQLEAELSKITTLYERSAPELFALLKPGGLLVLCIPEYHTRTGHYTLNSAPIFKKAGFTPSPTPFDPLIYRHPDQFVARRLEIYQK
jgi:tRNA G10  N-methylase Trm11